MKQLLFFIICFCFIIDSYCQQTWSKTYDLEVGYDNNFRNVDFVDSSLFVATAHICQEDTMPCYSISEFSVDGDLVNIRRSESNKLLIRGNCQTVLDTVTYTINSVFENGLYGFQVDIYDRRSGNSKVNTYHAPLDHRYVSFGAVFQDDYFYIYGQNSNQKLNVSSVLILKIDRRTDLLVDVYEYMEDDQFNACESMNVTPDGDLVFRNWFGGLGANDGAITTIDTAGNIIRNHRFIGSHSGPQSVNPFTIDANGRIYFTSDNALLSQDLLFPRAIDHVGYIEPEDDTITGTIPLPESYVYRTYEYTPFDMVSLQNGDIAICGFAFYKNTMIDIEQEEETSTTAFIARLSPDGEVIWMKRYMIPSGIFIQGNELSKGLNLENILELESGHLLAVGESRGGTIVNGNIIPEETEVWLLKVDPNGCIEGEECTEVIWIDGKFEHSYDPVFEIGDMWTYDWETEADPDNFNGEIITFQVTDTITEGNKLVHIIESSREGYDLKMYQDADKIYFYNEDSQNYELHYNFNVNHQYATTLTTCGESYPVIVAVDTIVRDFIHQIGVENTFNVDILDSVTNSVLASTSIIRGVGNTYGGLLLDPDPTCTEYPRPGDLRCLQAHDRNMNRQPYQLLPPDGFRPPDCDEDYISSVDEALIQVLDIDPNPTSGNLTIRLPEAMNGRLTIRDVTGHVVSTLDLDYTEEVALDLSAYHAGMYVIELVSANGETYIEKVILH